jgi:hypothetical protein
MHQQGLVIHVRFEAEKVTICLTYFKNILTLPSSLAAREIYASEWYVNFQAHLIWYDDPFNEKSFFHSKILHPVFRQAA